MKRLCVLLLAVLLVTAAQATVVTLGSDADTWFRPDRGPFGSDTAMNTHGSYNWVSYLRFDLSALEDAEITEVSLVLTKVPAPPAYRADTLVTGRFALYGMNNMEGNTAQDWDEATLTSNLAGEEWDVDTLMTESLADGRVVNLDGDDAGINITETITESSTVITLTGDDLIAFLQGRVDDGGLATFIIAFGDASAKGIGYATKEYETEAAHPLLQVTYVPEPATMVLLGLGSLLAIRRKHG